MAPRSWTDGRLPTLAHNARPSDMRSAISRRSSTRGFGGLQAGRGDPLRRYNCDKNIPKHLQQESIHSWRQKSQLRAVIKVVVDTTTNPARVAVAVAVSILEPHDANGLSLRRGE
jgi:hypothetical protein